MAQEPVTNLNVLDFQQLPPLVVDPKGFGSTATNAYKQISDIQARGRALTDKLPHSPLAGILTILNAQRMRGKEAELNELRISTKKQADAVTEATAKAARRKTKMSELVSTGRAKDTQRVADIWYKGNTGLAMDDVELHNKIALLPMTNKERNDMRKVMSEFEERLRAEGLNLKWDSSVNMINAVKQMGNDLALDRRKRALIKAKDLKGLANVLSFDKISLDDVYDIQQEVDQDTASGANQKGGTGDGGTGDGVPVGDGTSAPPSLALSAKQNKLKKETLRNKLKKETLTDFKDFGETAIGEGVEVDKPHGVPGKPSLPSKTFFNQTGEPTVAGFLMEVFKDNPIGGPNSAVYNYIQTKATPWLRKQIDSFPEQIRVLAREKWGLVVDNKGRMVITSPDGETSIVSRPTSKKFSIVSDRGTKVKGADSLGAAIEKVQTDAEKKIAMRVKTGGYEGSYDYKEEAEAERADQLADHIAAGGPLAGGKLLTQEDAIALDKAQAEPGAMSMDVEEYFPDGVTDAALKKFMAEHAGTKFGAVDAEIVPVEETPLVHPKAIENFKKLGQVVPWLREQAENPVVKNIAGALEKADSFIKQYRDLHVQKAARVLDDSRVGQVVLDAFDKGKIIFDETGEAIAQYAQDDNTKNKKVVGGWTNAWNALKKFVTHPPKIPALAMPGDTTVPDWMGVDGTLDDFAAANFPAGVPAGGVSTAGDQPPVVAVGGGQGGSSHFGDMLSGIESPVPGPGHKGITKIPHWKVDKNNNFVRDKKGHKVRGLAVGRWAIMIPTAKTMGRGIKLGFPDMNNKEIRSALEHDDVNILFRNDLLDLIMTKVSQNKYTKGWSILDKQAIAMTAYNSTAENYFNDHLNDIAPTSLQDFVDRSKGEIPKQNYKHMKKVIEAQKRTNSKIFFDALSNKSVTY